MWTGKLHVCMSLRASAACLGVHLRVHVMSEHSVQDRHVSDDYASCMHAASSSLCHLHPTTWCSLPQYVTTFTTDAVNHHCVGGSGKITFTVPLCTAWCRDAECGGCEEVDQELIRLAKAARANPLKHPLPHDIFVAAGVNEPRIEATVFMRKPTSGSAQWLLEITLLDITATVRRHGAWYELLRRLWHHLRKIFRR